MKMIRLLFVVVLLVAVSADAATFTVSSSADSGLNTLRQAILDSNASTPPNEILFSIGSPYTITPTSTLPDITNAVDINALIGYPNPTVRLDGSSVGGLSHGLEIRQTANCKIQGLQVYSFSNAGIYIDRSHSNTVMRCLIYSNDTGIAVQDGNFNLIGGDTENEKNVISGNSYAGVSVHRVTASVSNNICGNFIGTDITGSNAWANASYGVYVHGGFGTCIGGSNETPGGLFPGNLISGNGTDGIRMYTDDGQTLIQGNLIGTDRSGQIAVPNGNFGVYCFGSPSNTFGGSDGHVRNTISGNGLYGLYLGGLDSTRNVVIGNYIGTDNAGSFAVPNGQDGIHILNAPLNRIGGPGSEGNVLSGNTQSGLDINGYPGNYGATGTVVQGNFVGTDASGLLPIPNRGLAGISLECLDTLIGGTNAGNLVAGNLGSGIRISEEGDYTRIIGNKIGPYSASLTALSNRWDGIALLDVANCAIGGVGQYDRNIISGNGGSGVSLSGTTCVDNVIGGNFIGVDIIGSNAVGNSDSGIYFYEAVSNQIGIASSGGGNIISANEISGINVVYGYANIVHNNYVGTDVSGMTALGNGQNGIRLYDSRMNEIGGYASDEENLLSGNGDSGLGVFGGSAGNTIKGNWIGTDSTRTNGLGNRWYGIRFNNAYSNIVGGGGSDGNVVAFNHFQGVRVEPDSHGIAIVGNAIFANADLGIDLAALGFTTNDPGDVDTGPNALQNFPVITAVSNNGTHIILSATFSSEPNKMYWLEFFFNRRCDASGYGEGEYPLDQITNLMTDGSGNATITDHAIELHGPPPDFITATASDLALWNTSEFSPFVLLDSDGDGMGDGFEYEHFGHHTAGDPTADKDGDGSLNLDEFNADTDASSDTSYLEIAGMLCSPTGTLLGVETTMNREYSFRQNDMLNTVEWPTAVTWFNGTGGLEIREHTTIYTSRYYRVRARVPQVD